MNNGLIAIIGAIIVDVSLSSDKDAEHKMRLGGIMHAARSAWAMGVPYEIYYIAPPYLKESIEDYAYKHGCQKCECIGSIDNAPGVILIQDIKELKNQGYSLLMAESSEVTTRDFALSDQVKKIIIFPGQFDLKNLLDYIYRQNITCSISIDIANGIDSLDRLRELMIIGIKYDFIFNSTSHHIIDVDMNNILYEVKDYTRFYVMKEGRGGGYIRNEDGNLVNYFSFLQETAHSVGVGDCFDIVIIDRFEKVGIDKASKIASFVASQYASTSFPDDLYQKVQQSVDLEESIYRMSGVRLPWSERKEIKIYIAAPDFDWMDDTHIRYIEKSLEYNNFTPILPIKINGQIYDFNNRNEVSRIFQGDLDLIQGSQIILGIILNDDHGTLIEIGYAKGLNKHVVVYDPLKLARNPFLTHLPDFISSDPEEIINHIFEFGGTYAEV